MSPHRARRPRAEPLPLRVLLRRPLLVALSGVSVVALTLLGLAVLVVPVLGNRITTYDQMSRALQDSHVAMLNQETGLRGYLITREERFLQPYEAGVADLREVDAEIASWTGVDAELAGRLAELTAAHQRWTEKWVRPMLAEQPAVGDAVALAELLNEDKSLFDDYRAIEAQARAAVEERRAGAMALQELALHSGALVGVGTAAAVAAVLRRAYRRLEAQVVPPTQEVRDALAALAAGDLTRRAGESGSAELRRIAADVNALGHALQERNQLVAARERDLVAARDEAERAGQAKTTFLATMSHEIRTPLNAVLGLTDLLLATDLTDEQRGHLETVAGSGDSLLSLINDILDFSKIEAGELDLEAAPFDLVGVVYDVAQLLAPTASGAGLDLLVDVAGDGPWQVVGDGSRVRQVVTNLVGNAVKFTNEGHVVIRLTGTVSDGRLRCGLSVADTGIGISPDQRHRLFRSFSQVDASVTRSYGGTGLGLAISQRIARAMGGDIQVDSELGVGSTFTVAIDLPLAPAVPHGPSGDGLAGLRLLVVDDSPTNLRILEHQLSRHGAECILAGGGPAALELLDQGTRIDVAVLDLDMPGMDGDVLAARLRARPGTADLPLVLLSSSATLPAERYADFDARINKPVRPERLAQTVRSVALRDRTEGVTGGGQRGRRALPAPARSLRVLVAEDNAVNAQLMGLYLRQLGHACTHVGDGEQAVDAVLRGTYDVVLMDAQMPVLGGVEATAAIRLLPLAARQPRIYAVTASVLAADRTAFLEAGADGFLTKPIRMATLRDALDEVMLPPDAPDAPDAPVGPGPQAALDPETVEDLRDLGDDAFAHLYTRYLTTLDDAVAAIVAAADRPSWSLDDEGSVPRLAHGLKGSSAALGATALAGVCHSLETVDPTDLAVGDTLAVLDRERSRVRAAVTALLDDVAR
ncbi:hybrid sensor histidine kinase/response regulator [Geodermatophilus pulveris]|uniref:hybrid sensor histidine kinase/response regulator n=1 Tax=Geodermatophilus pulveris TaxID=1564159 RepID=UPI00117B81CB|nr:response regulator [Geodermatophilus pulveris]